MEKKDQSKPAQKHEIEASSSKIWQPKQVFVSGIPYSATEEELRAVFKDQAHALSDLKLPKYQDSGRLIGYAHLTFTEEAAFNSALALSGTKLGGRYLDIKPAEGSSKPDFKSSQCKFIIL